MKKYKELLENISKEVEQLDEKSDQAKRNKTMKNVLDASRGAQYKLQGNVVPDRDEKHKTGQAQNKAIGRALRNEEIELDEVLKGADAGEYVKDFQDSDAPQFKGKSKEKRHQMAIAAYLEAKRKNK